MKSALQGLHRELRGGLRVMMLKKTGLLAICIAMMPGMLFVPGAATGAALIVKPSISARLYYDDNAALTTRPHDASSGSELLGAIKLSRNTDAMELQGVARLNVLLDAGGDVYRDKDNQVLSLSFARKGELSRWSLSGSWRRDSIIRSVNIVDEDAPDQEPDDDVDASLVQTSVRRNRFVIKPSWSYQFSPRSQVAAGYSFDNVVFEDTQNTALFDYQNHSLSGTYSYGITERSQITNTLGMTRYRADLINRDYDSFRFMLGLRYKYSETASGHFQVGRQQSSYTGSNEDGDRENYLFRISGEKRTGLTKFSARLSRSTFASGAGDVVNSDELSFNMTRELSEKMRFSLRMRAFQNESLRSDNPGANRRYMSIAPTLGWQITRQWSANVSYRYRRQKRDTDSYSAEGNTVYLSVNYVHPAQL